ncbi:hypothetical protein SPRG_12519 [Saprolegnia parasitica CBS 223.65]|uniref:Cyclic nucleotide-binding domain-containing protein n=1 Tax=Saprolegnia parasitica (strain CBS 223.65) TaxID=695850 RepID=A0A067C4I7_SAPPC|nr:hypothetical protein SPRG_12519 [Saprolegnia parasitica CBS 223.65]KDO21476.1 hypothetical protein SPRG_12519 [Saprolegnia parasitica CBS 223.65]|eukprot:XP_012207820.1 hypothetical protein SPRG_12519 [Saprolegnia parasitica CBS 223.65]
MMPESVRDAAIASSVVAVDLGNDIAVKLPKPHPARGDLRFSTSFRDKWGQLGKATRRPAGLLSLRYGLTPSAPLRPFMINPTGHFRRVWDMLLASAVIYLCWYIPFNVAIVWWTPTSELAVFRTAVVVYGEVIDDPSLVAQKYLKSWFLVDFISVFPAEWLVPNSKSSRKGVKLLKYIKLPRMLRLSQLVRRFRRFQRYEGAVAIFSALIFAVHIAGCGWILAMAPCEYLPATAPPDLHVFCDPSNAFEAYSLGFHYALSIMTLASLDNVYASFDPLCGGYRLLHLNATTIPDGILVMSNLFAIAGILLCAIMVGSCVFVVESWNRAGYQFRKRIDIINHEMEFLQLPEHLRHRIQTYHQYLWTHQGSATEKVTLLQDTGMSEPLRKEIAIFMYRDMLAKIPLFRAATDQLLGLVCMCLKTVIYLPRDIVITRGELGKDLFVIAKGSVVVLAKTNAVDETDVVLTEGAFFGEVGLLMAIERTRTVVAKTICELGVLTKLDFDSLMHQFPAFAVEIQKIMLQRRLHATDTAKRDIPMPSLVASVKSTTSPRSAWAPSGASVEARLDRIEELLTLLVAEKERAHT